MSAQIIIIGKNCPQEKIEELQKILADNGCNLEIVESEHAEHGTVRLIEDCSASIIQAFKKHDELYNIHQDYRQGYFNSRKGGKRRTKKEWE